MTSGDANEWQAVVSPHFVQQLLAALRREGDLLAAIGGDADDELLARLAARFGPQGSRALEAFREFLDAGGIPYESRFWAGSSDDDDGDDDPARDDLASVLRAALGMVSRDGADFTWSSWHDREHAETELRGLLERLDTDPVAVTDVVSVIFAPTGPMQELALASGWAGEYLELVARADAISGAA